MDYETPSTIEFGKLLYKILSFKCELETREVEILVWRYHNGLKFREIGKLLGISYQCANQIYLGTIKKIKVSELTALK